ncbi:MAG TPA: molecular chaperone Tir [Bacteroidales bacterium]|nr:molecular chaperone Tir [Bacteroidales bacterium]
MTNFQKVENYLLELEYSIVRKNEAEQLFVINNPEAGISNLVLVIAEPLLVLEQLLFNVNASDNAIYMKLLIKNRDIIHGAFALTADGSQVLFRETLQIENLDLNELEGSLNSLSLLMTEISDLVITYNI